MKYILKLTSFFCIVFVFTTSLGQEKQLEKANENFDSYAFIDAREAYLEVAQQGYRSEDLLKRLADSYYFTADYDQASIWYGALYDYMDSVDPEYLYRYALSLKSDRQYDASDAIMEELVAARGSDDRGELYKNERNYLEEIEMQSGRFEMQNVAFNSNLSDHAPTFYNGMVVYASNRPYGRATQRIHNWNEQPFLDLYMANSDATLGADAIHLPSEINTTYHESSAVFSRDGMTMYFTRNNFTKGDYKVDSNGTNRLKLYKGVNVDGEWQVMELPFNSDEYSVAHPALSADGKTLYFASDMPGGEGMSDLYKVSVDGDSFGTPESLGNKINTEGRETFPFISSDDRMYFASDGHVGLGGLDIFVTDIENDSFGEVFNVGKPINSADDDFTFVINGKSGKGYFASNRPGGMGDDDIYSFRRLKDPITSCYQNIEGTVLNQVTDDPISGADVMLYDSAGKQVAEVVSNAKGAFEFSLDCNEQYSIRAKKQDYGTTEKSFATNAAIGRNLERTLFLKTGQDLSEKVEARPGLDLAKLLLLNPIYFDLDQSDIRPDAQIELRKVIAVLKQYPEIKIDVRSHTDSRANDNYNMALSERRNKATRDYIAVQGGIDASRLSGRGYGESQLVNGCINGAKCSEGAHQLNRRSEFIIVE